MRGKTPPVGSRPVSLNLAGPTMGARLVGGTPGGNRLGPAGRWTSPWGPTRETAVADDGGRAPRKGERMVEAKQPYAGSRVAETREAEDLVAWGNRCHRE